MTDKQKEIVANILSATDTMTLYVALDAIVSKFLMCGWSEEKVRKELGIAISDILMSSMPLQSVILNKGTSKNKGVLENVYKQLSDMEI